MAAFRPGRGEGLGSQAAWPTCAEASTARRSRCRWGPAAIGRGQFLRRVLPAQPVAIEEDNPTRDAPVIDMRPAAGRRKAGLQTRHLRISEPEETGHVSALSAPGEPCASADINGVVSLGQVARLARSRAFRFGQMARNPPAQRACVPPGPEGAPLEPAGARSALAEWRAFRIGQRAHVPLWLNGARSALARWRACRIS